VKLQIVITMFFFAKSERNEHSFCVSKRGNFRTLNYTIYAKKVFIFGGRI